MRKGYGVFSAVFAVLILLYASCFSAFSVENHYYIKEMNMSLDLPDNMPAITRESPETDRYFSLFGLDYSSTMSNFKNNNIYLQGMYEDSSRIFTVTMLSDENSIGVGNYSNLSDEQIIDVENSFLAEAEYTSCTVQKYNNYVFIQLQLKTQSDGQEVYATQYNTVIDGNNITLTLQPAKGSELINEDYQTMNNILQSVEFDGHGTYELQNLITNPNFWIIVLMAILIIILVVALIIKKIKRQNKTIKRKEKKIKDQKILMELAKEYTSQPRPVTYKNKLSKTVSKNVKELENPLYESEESAEDIITQFRNSKDFVEISSKRTFSPNKETGDTLNTVTSDNNSVENEEVIVSSENEKEKGKNNIPLDAEDKHTLKIVTPEDETNQDEPKEQITTEKYTEDKERKTAVQKTKVDSDNNANEIAEESYQGKDGDLEDEFAQEHEEDKEYSDEYLEDNPIIGSDESFDQSEDYFDEALNNDIYSRETVDDEDNYENKFEKYRINKVDKDAVKKKAKTAGAVALNGILIFLNGVKTFFIHLGYFCTNLFRLIKRNLKRRRQRKAEMLRRRQQEESKRRREENLRRKQRNISKDANGLVKVHSRNEYSRKGQRR